MNRTINRNGAGDLALGALVAGALITQVATGNVSGPIWVAVLGGTILGAGMLLRRRSPWAAWATTFATICAIGLLGVAQQGNYAVIIAGFVALYTLAGRTSWRGVTTAWVIGLVLVFIAAVPSSGVLKSSFAVFVLAAAVVIGRAAGAYRRVADQLQATVLELDARRADLIEKAIAEEKVKIARELHDVIAHSVSVMVIQASAAEAMLDTTPEQARSPLIAVQESGRQALGELRRLLAILRPGATAPATLLPQPGLDDLSEIATTLRDAGIAVDLSLDATEEALPPGVDLAAYRIVQEALTNVVKHAGAHNVSIVISRRAQRIDIEVADDGHGITPEATEGHGVIGMRERVAAYDGELSLGPRPGGGHIVSARLTIPCDQ